MFSLQHWKVPALCLLLLTAFPHNTFATTHNILAISFFITAGYAMLKSRRFRTLFAIYLLGIPIAMINLLYGEIVSILCLCVFHGALLYKYHKILIKKKTFHEFYLDN